MLTHCSECNAIYNTTQEGCTDKLCPSCVSYRVNDVGDAALITCYICGKRDLISYCNVLQGERQYCDDHWNFRMSATQDDVSIYTLDDVDNYNRRVRKYMKRKKCGLRVARTHVTPIYTVNKRQPHLEELPDMFAMIDAWAYKWIDNPDTPQANIRRDRVKAYRRMFERIECILVNADISDYKANDLYWTLKFRAFEKAMRAKDNRKFVFCDWLIEGCDSFGECPEKWSRCFKASDDYWRKHHHYVHIAERRREKEKKLADAAEEQEE